jgi:hypothetical protein
MTPHRQSALQLLRILGGLLFTLGGESRGAEAASGIVDRDARVTKANCRLCGETDYGLIRVKNEFHLERCRTCSLVQVTDDLSAVHFEDLYDQAFFEEVYDWQHESRGKRIADEKFDDRLDDIEQLASGRGKMLEVGCAFGYFLDAARSRGWQTRGIEQAEFEPVEITVALLREKLLKRLHVYDLLPRWGVSDELLVFARTSGG